MHGNIYGISGITSYVFVKENEYASYLILFGNNCSWLSWCYLLKEGTCLSVVNIIHDDDRILTELGCYTHIILGWCHISIKTSHGLSTVCWYAFKLKQHCHRLKDLCMHLGTYINISYESYSAIGCKSFPVDKAMLRFLICWTIEL